MTLNNILSNLKTYSCDKELLKQEITGISIDPLKVKLGDLFVLLKSENKNSIDLALNSGAVAYVTDKNYNDKKRILVRDARSAYALISKKFYDNACDKIKLIAVTGTNGKTTTTKIISDILKFSGKKVGTIGTLGATLNGKIVDTGFTTPDPEILHKTLFEMKKEGIEIVVMEASAHAIELKKLDGLKFEVSLFTNLSQDHLDFFGDMEKYFEAKKKLFSPQYSKIGIICKDDHYGKNIFEEMKIPMLTYGKEKGNDCFAKDVETNVSGTKFLCNVFNDWLEIECNFVGEYNVQNILGAILAVKAIGIPNEKIYKAIKHIVPAEGRFNHIKCGGRSIIVDYAHTPDGLQKVLSTARKIAKSRLICVFGCGGNRDRKKRPIMGKIAEEYCDEVFVTSDNPRFEKPLEIISEIEQGMEKNNHKIFEKREDAICEAIKACKEGDVLVVAGKGGEKYQDIAGIKQPYDDFKVIKDVIKNLLKEEKERLYAD